jgi:hypothetical protein
MRNIEYNRRLNALRRAKDIQDFYREVWVEGQPSSFVWERHIYPRFKVSKSRFYEILAMRPDLEIRRLDEEYEKGKQPTLF